MPQSVELPVNTTTAGHQTSPSIAMDADGDFVVVWKDSSSTDIIVQRYNSLGVPQSGEVTVISVGEDPSIAMDADGDFVVAWTGDR